MLNLLYFAWVRERTGHASERVERPAGVKTVADLIAWQNGRGGGFAQAFADPKQLRVAVNQDHVQADHPIGDDDEVAFFPPVTGG